VPIRAARHAHVGADFVPPLNLPFVGCDHAGITNFRQANMPLTPDDVSDEAAERLSWPLDFRIEPPSQGGGWFSVDGVEQFQQIGSDAAGGAFVLLPPAQRVLYVSSEGQAGIIAADFEEFIQLIVACPVGTTFSNIRPMAISIRCEPPRPRSKQRSRMRTR